MGLNNAQGIYQYIMSLKQSTPADAFGQKKAYQNATAAAQTALKQMNAQLKAHADSMQHSPYQSLVELYNRAYESGAAGAARENALALGTQGSYNQPVSEQAADSYMANREAVYPALLKAAAGALQRNTHADAAQIGMRMKENAANFNAAKKLYTTAAKAAKKSSAAGKTSDRRVTASLKKLYTYQKKKEK